MYLVDQVQRAILLIVNFRYLLKSCVTDLEVVFERIRSQSHFGTGYHYLSILFQLQKACPTPPLLQQRRLHVHPPLVQHSHARPPPCHICSADWGPFTRLPQLFPRDQDRAAGGQSGTKAHMCTTRGTVHLARPDVRHNAVAGLSQLHNLHSPANYLLRKMPPDLLHIGWIPTCNASIAELEHAWLELQEPYKVDVHLVGGKAEGPGEGLEQGPGS